MVNQYIPKDRKMGVHWLVVQHHTVNENIIIWFILVITTNRERISIVNFMDIYAEKLLTANSVGPYRSFLIHNTFSIYREY